MDALSAYVAAEAAVTEEQRMAKRGLMFGFYQRGTSEHRRAVGLAWDAARARAKARRSVRP